MGSSTFTGELGDRTSDRCQITRRGWDYLDELDRGSPVTSRAFVAMWFDPSMDVVWIEGIKPALERAGYVPYRVDNDLVDVGRIEAKIEAETRRSRFLVADVTAGRQGVYYKAGYAMGIRSPVIWTVRSGHRKDMHFDTGQCSHINWDTLDQLAQELEAVVIDAIGERQSGIRY